MHRAVGLSLLVVLAAPGCKKKVEAGCPPSVAVEIDYPGATPAEVERQVVMPVEAAIAGLERVGAIHAMAAEGRAVFEIEVSGDPEVISRQLFAALEKTQASLPEDAGLPRVQQRRRVERLMIATSPRDLGERITSIEIALNNLEGVEAVVTLGAPSPEIRVSIDPTRLTALGLSADDVVRAIRSGDGELGERAVGTRPDGSVIALRDVATITDGAAAGPAAFAGGQAVVVFAIVTGKTAPAPGALRAAGVESVSEPIEAAMCPRGYGLGLRAASATATAGDAERLVSHVADLPVVVLDRADLLDRGSGDVEIIATGSGVADKLRAVPGLEVYAPGGAAAFVELTGDDAAALERAAAAIAAAAAAVEGVTGIRELPARGAPTIRVKPDTARLARLGLTTFDVAIAVRRATSGEIAAILRGGPRSARTSKGEVLLRADRAAVPVPVRVLTERPAGARGRHDSFEDVVLQVPNGGLVPLSQVAAIELGSDRSIYRRDRRRRHHLRIAVADERAAGRVEAAVAAVVTPGSGVTATVTAGGL